ncbi:HBR538Wp [Eremothecium sinecaudum]|uniref:HBR538Wp n=1 Tax=Eremothecium sinecaudum TaxID=45286 RepID=A0A120K1I9_9SACH|nr:HBR538Wp [Eremothecium sinecaudum]AMD19439.1 HBR538Wp [Eremothecium sinecaudum]
MSGTKEPTKSQDLRRKRILNARAIKTEAANASPGEFVEGGSLLKVPEFISSRQFEIKQLQDSIHHSRKSSSIRSFQSLPRKLRRRKASHNVKRIPKRLRNRALREMKASNQTTTMGTRDVFRKRKHGLNARKLYRLKMAVNLLRLASRNTSMQLMLPEELKPEKCKLRTSIKSLRRQIKDAQKGKAVRKLNNRLGSYDNTGINKLAPKPIGRIKYMKRQRFFTWLPTHVWSAKRCHMIKRWGYQIPWSPTQKCFRLTHRLTGQAATSNGAMCADTSYFGTLVASSESKPRLDSFVKQLTGGRAVRDKYSKSQHLFEGLFYLAADTVPIGPGTLLWVGDNKIMIRLHPSIYKSVFDFAIQEELDVQDCRFSLASITITGAKSLQALSQIIRTPSETQSYKQFKSVYRVTDSSVFPDRTVFAFRTMDPRHLSSPKNLSTSSSVDYSTIIDLQQKYPREEIASVLSELCDPSSRENSYNNQQPLKDLARRRRKLLVNPKRTNLIPFDPKIDPQIPIFIVRQPKSMNWVILLPWYWMLPFWYQLNRVTFVYPMGIKQLHQQCYERGLPHFPDDYPFTATGYQENSVYKSISLKAAWERKPAGKRVNYEKITHLHAAQCPGYSGELGDWFSSDWRLLQVLQNGISYIGKDNLQMYNPNRTTQFDPATGLSDINHIRDLLELHSNAKNDSIDGNLPIVLYNKAISNYDASSAPEITSPPQLSILRNPLSVIAIVCTAVERGHFRDNARLYNIPQQDLDHWLEVAKGLYKSNGKRNHDLSHPLPGIQHLVGFITSGTYHLGKGASVGSGFIASDSASENNHNYILVRNVGTNTYRLAQWRQVFV